MDFEGEGDRTFNTEEVHQVVKESVDSCLGSATFQHSKVALWQATIVENALKRLANLNKPFKYVVTCMISQNTGGATHTAHTCFWDAETDGFTKYRFESATMVCLTTVYGMGI
mmetsp:Transcript_38799/g.95480  ORF Transcript_38799/g.95480 Transcript_38799/m.95480 type:complete len:113 (+) Transcript_38799:188-526(+)|eukprot:CAMPEP_0206236100 /NCGR_PEP_ID=MMETSP0047_2-20121206/13520_1 /ASSEMBLY_ACC=CAM_ASM_000192 /TAXON_ID=195065 /ORGANISM="Chroomonas mesostigmatica_cf, Strain CCMP1168" /LENGTH=112 /DNA_ID=CAMNT_0053660383 /DNA_START=188 /DNA_END=526 /DNA_ORIENTATION=+